MRQIEALPTLPGLGKSLFLIRSYTTVRQRPVAWVTSLMRAKGGVFFGLHVGLPLSKRPGQKKKTATGRKLLAAHPWPS